MKISEFISQLGYNFYHDNIVYPDYRGIINVHARTYTCEYQSCMMYICLL